MSTPLFPAAIFPPNQQGYQYTPGQDKVEIKLDGGASRYRRDILGAAHYVTCSISCTPIQYNLARGFFREFALNSTIQFRMNLIIDTPFLIPYLCLVMGEPKLTQVDGLLYQLDMQLEVTPNPIRSFFAQLTTSGGPAFTDPADLSEFPVGRQVQMVGCHQIVASTDVNLDGIYTITGFASQFDRQMSGAAGVNAAWTTLAGLTPNHMFVDTNDGKYSGAIVLLPQ